MAENNEIILYQPDETIKLEVRLENETVWLTQQQMAELFVTTPQNITMHIRNIYKEGELMTEATCKDFLQVRKEGTREVKRIQKIYNLDVIISVGYRVKSFRGTQFRQWALRVLKDYLLKGYSVNQRLERLEQRVTQTENKIDFFVKTSLPPVEGIFYDGQIFDAYKFVCDLIRSAKQRIVLIDNYVDDSVLQMLDKRQSNVSATIYTKNYTPQLQLDLQRHNAQYAPIAIQSFTQSHDRFLIIDDTIYHIGASLKDLGKKWFAFSKMEMAASEVLTRII
ncbi:MAG: virulence RhuM family protein [Bacteroidales bacterium]|nr:virulence RhuM family protein [Bacteroidales bacterium]